MVKDTQPHFFPRVRWAANLIGTAFGFEPFDQNFLFGRHRFGKVFVGKAGELEHVRHRAFVTHIKTHAFPHGDRVRHVALWVLVDMDDLFFFWNRFEVLMDFKSLLGFAVAFTVNQNVFRNQPNVNPLNGFVFFVHDPVLVKNRAERTEPFQVSR